MFFEVYDTESPVGEVLPFDRDAVSLIHVKKNTILILLLKVVNVQC